VYCHRLLTLGTIFTKRFLNF